MRVLFIVPKSPDAASARYRCAHLAEALRIHDETVVADIVSAQADEIAIAHDVVVLHRLRWNLAEPFVAAARRIGAKVVYSADDLIFSSEYAYHVGFLYPDDPTRYLHHQAETSDQWRTLTQSDAALVSTAYLKWCAEVALAERTPLLPVFVVPNVLSRALIRMSRYARDARHPPQHRTGVTLGYLSGSATHDGDLASVAVPLADVMREDESVRLVLVGEVALPKALHPMADAGRIRRHPLVPWVHLPGLLSGLDINLAPLETSRAFNHAKSAVKWLEASACGVVTLATPTHGFSEQASATDCLFADSPGAWRHELTNAMQHRERRGTLAEQAERAVAERYTTDAVAGNVHAVFTEIVAGSTATGSATIAKPLRTRIIRALRGAETRIFDMAIRWDRHKQLLWDERKRGGTLQ